MLIWDTGEYFVLPYRIGSSLPSTESDDEMEVSDADTGKELSEPEKLYQAFQQRKIRLRLRGTHLPANYVLILRLTKDNYRREQPTAPSRKRKRKDPQLRAVRTPTPPGTQSESELDSKNHRNSPSNKRVRPMLASLSRRASPPRAPRRNLVFDDDPKSHPAMDIEPESVYSVRRPTTAKESEDAETEVETIRRTNAYPGATNSVNSVHQRKWYLSLDRRGSGFVARATSKAFRSRVWSRRQNEDGSLGGFPPFRVLGRDVETSVVTGRRAADVLNDEGVDRFVPRGRWRPVTE